MLGAHCDEQLQCIRAKRTRKKFFKPVCTSDLTLNPEKKRRRAMQLFSKRQQVESHRPKEERGKLAHSNRVGNPAASDTQLACPERYFSFKKESEDRI
jgi:hypothetical protein